MAGHVSTTAGSTRTARASSPTVNTSARASTGLWAASRCAIRSSPFPTLAVPIPDWWRWKASAVRSGCVKTARRQTSLRSSLPKTRRRMSQRENSSTGTSSLKLSRAALNPYQVRKSFLFTSSHFFKLKLWLDYLMILDSKVFPFHFFFIKHLDCSLRAKCLTTRSASSKPLPGPSAPRLVGLASPPESPTTTVTAGWPKSQGSVMCDHAPSPLTPVLRWAWISIAAQEGNPKTIQTFKHFEKQHIVVFLWYVNH